jgi:hypothetical protein
MNDDIKGLREALAEVDRDGFSWGAVASLLGTKPPTPRRRRRRPSLASARRRAEKAGMVVTGETFHADGSRSFVYGKPDSEERTDNPWDRALKHDSD